MQVQQPYINKTITDPAKDDYNEVGQLIDEVAKHAKYPGDRDSLIQQSALLKLNGNLGKGMPTYINDRNFADKKPGFIRRGVNKLKSLFKSGQQTQSNPPQQTANQQQNQANANQQTGNQPQGQQTQSNQPQQNNSQVNQSSNLPVQSNANAQQNQANANQQGTQGNQSLAPANQEHDKAKAEAANFKQNVGNGLSDAQKRSIEQLADQQVKQNGFIGNSYLTQDSIAELAHSDQHQNRAIDDAQLDLINRHSVTENPDAYRDDRGRVNRAELDQAKRYNRRIANLTNDGYNQHTANNLNNALNAYYKNRNAQLVKSNDMNQESHDYWANQFKTLSNKKMINLDNIRYFSESSQDYIIRMYADSLTEEEMQAALKRKDRKKKILDVLKTIGKVGLAGAALYGGAKWYQNGGKDYLNNVMDKSSDFVSKTGDAAVDTAKEVGTDTKDEANRVIDELAKKRLEGKSTEPEVNSDEVKLLEHPNDKEAPLLRQKMEIERRIRDLEVEITEIQARMDQLNGSEGSVVDEIHNKPLESNRLSGELSAKKSELDNLRSQLSNLQ